MVTKHLTIQGRVQGVGFRYSFFYAAKNAGVNGWVKNSPDGTVEAVIQGTPEQVETVIDWAKKGPSMAHVTYVDVSEGFGEFSTFEIEP